MALFTGMSSGDYSRQHMPQPAKSDGPWGEAIQYWLDVKGWRQADLIREIQNLQKPEAAVRAGKRKKSKGNKNTVSTACLGRDCNTKTLRIIATALGVPLDGVLVSPDRKSANEARKQMILEIAEKVARELEKPPAYATTHETPLPTIQQKVKELGQFTEDTEHAERTRIVKKRQVGRKK